MGYRKYLNLYDCNSMSIVTINYGDVVSMTTKGSYVIVKVKSEIEYKFVKSELMRQLGGYTK